MHRISILKILDVKTVMLRLYVTPKRSHISVYPCTAIDAAWNHELGVTGMPDTVMLQKCTEICTVNMVLRTQEAKACHNGR